jgi:hypothetical protein
VIALQALTEYAFRARLKDITDMSITLELPSTAGFRKTVHIDNTSFTDIHTFEVSHTDISYCYCYHFQIVGQLCHMCLFLGLFNDTV